MAVGDNGFVINDIYEFEQIDSTLAIAWYSLVLA